MKEAVVEFGAPATLRGIVSAGDVAAGSDLGVVLLNAGVIHKVGPNRLWVDVGRGCAELGVAALRFDFSGVGDSPPRSDTLPFERASVAATRSAMDWLAQHHRIGRFVLVGLCSGAEIAFKTALEDPRVVAAILVNPPRFAEEPDPEVVRALDEEVAVDYTWRVSLFSIASWKRLLTGRVNYGAVLKAFRRRLVPEAPAPAIPGRDMAAFDALAQRGVMLRVIVADGDWGLRYLRRILGRRLGELERAGAVSLQVIRGADHLMTPAHARQQTKAGVLDVVAALAGPRVTPAQPPGMP